MAKDFAYVQSQFQGWEDDRQSISVKKYSTIHFILFAIRFASPYSKWLLYILAAMLMESLSSLAMPWPLKIIIDNIIGAKALPTWLQWMNFFPHDESNVGFAAIVAALFVIISMIGSLAGYIQNYFSESVAQNIANDLRRRMYHHLQRLSFGYYDSHQTGKLLSTITADVATIQDFASSTLLGILVDSLTILGMLLIMFYINPGYTLAALAVTPFLIFFVARFKRVMKKATREVRNDQSNMFVILQQGLESIRSIKAFGRQDLEEDRLRKASIETVAAALQARKVKSALSPIVTLTVSLCTAMVLWHGAGLVMSNEMTVGALTVFLWYMNRFFIPVQDLGKLTNTVAQATVAYERIQAILDTDDFIPQKPNAKDPGILKGNIVFDQVQFAYRSDSDVLHEINLKINSGQRVGICGPTGSGKSTIVSLIARFYDPTAGRVLIDGADISDFNLEKLRNQFGFVLQETVLFYGTVGENIAYGRPGATREEIIGAAKLANAHGFISRMYHGYDTLVGERGLTLSAGQKQLIGIARAILRNAPILILDEPTAFLDSESEKLVMEGLEKLMEGRTVITIAHRLSTIRDADKIIVLDNGFIVEEGTHDELISGDGLYADLYKVQTRASHSQLRTVQNQGKKTLDFETL